MAYKLIRFTPSSNPTQLLTQDLSLIAGLMLATGANTILIAGASTGLNLESQTPQTNLL